MMSNNNNNNNNNINNSGNAPLAYFIGHIPRGATEAEVEKVFAPHGNSPQFHMHRDNEGRSRGFGWLRFANPVSSLTTRGPFRLRDFELTVEVSNSKMANEAGGGMRANNNNNNNNNNNYSRQQQQQQQQRYRKQDDRNAHSIMRSNNRNSHVMPSGQTSMRQGSSIHSHTDRSLQSGQGFHAPPLSSSIPQANSSSSLLQPPSASPSTAAAVTTSTQANNMNTSSLHKNEEVEAHGRLQSQTTRRDGEEKEKHRRTRPRRRQRHHSTSTVSQSSKGYDEYHSRSNSASVHSSQRRRSSASVSSVNSSASASSLNSHKGSHQEKHSHRHSHRPHRHRRRRHSSSSLSSTSSVGHSPRHHRSRHDETNNAVEHSVERSRDKSSIQSHRHHRHKHHRQEPPSNYPHHSASSLTPAVPANNLSGNNTPTLSNITSTSTLPQALAASSVGTAQTQEIAPPQNNSSSQHPTNVPNAGANVAMHEMFVCLPMSLCPAQFMCDPRVFTARLDRSRVGALTICGSVLQAANMLSALQPSAPSTHASVSSNNNTNKVNNTNFSAPQPPPPPGPPPSSIQAPARLPLTSSSQNTSIPMHSMMQTSKHTSPPPPPPPPPPGPPPNSTGGPAIINSGMANQRMNVMRPQGR